MLTCLQLGDAEAQIAVQTIRAELKRRNKAAAIVVADRHGEPLASLRTDGAPLPAMLIASNKAFTAARQNARSGELGRGMREDGADFSFFGDPRYMGWPGGIPVRVGGELVGAVAVSGLSGEEDEELALLGIAAIEAGLAKEAAC